MYSFLPLRRKQCDGLNVMFERELKKYILNIVQYFRTIFMLIDTIILVYFVAFCIFCILYFVFLFIFHDFVFCSLYFVFFIL